ncbi:hypothetical protein [Cellulomonas sp. PhB150]|uniref:hypothetical protein n=1 Tax=Cellulomonas sp. PhB150 TaxID=2485188 RepID=UPI0011CE6B16|nr:hypothetical protein [Cellulomonas sp. PhB150]
MAIDADSPDPVNVETELDSMLIAVGPRTSSPSPARAAALAELIRTTRHESQRPAHGRRRASAVALAGALVVLGGAAAAAATDVWHAPWMARPAVEVQYTVASTGERCALTFGDLEGEPDAVAAAKTYLGGIDVLSNADVDGALAAIRGDGAFSDSVSSAGRLGSEEYSVAVSYAIAELLDAEMLHEGFGAHAVSAGSYTSSCAGDRS